MQRANVRSGGVGVCVTEPPKTATQDLPFSPLSDHPTIGMPKQPDFPYHQMPKPRTVFRVMKRIIAREWLVLIGSSGAGGIGFGNRDSAISA